MKHANQNCFGKAPIYLYLVLISFHILSSNQSNISCLITHLITCIKCIDKHYCSVMYNLLGTFNYKNIIKIYEERRKGLSNDHNTKPKINFGFHHVFPLCNDVHCCSSPVPDSKIPNILYCSVFSCLSRLEPFGFMPTQLPFSNFHEFFLQSFFRSIIVFLVLSIIVNILEPNSFINFKYSCFYVNC